MKKKTKIDEDVVVKYEESWLSFKEAMTKAVAIGITNEHDDEAFVRLTLKNGDFITISSVKGEYESDNNLQPPSCTYSKKMVYKLVKVED